MESRDQLGVFFLGHWVLWRVTGTRGRQNALYGDCSLFGEQIEEGQWQSQYFLCLAAVLGAAASVPLSGEETGAAFRPLMRSRAGLYVGTGEELDVLAILGWQAYTISASCWQGALYSLLGGARGSGVGNEEPFASRSLPGCVHSQ